MHRLLIANRGEIAVRIARAAAAEEIQAVAIAAADEPNAPHLAAADAVRLLPGTGPAAYLDVAASYEKGRGLNVAAHWEIDDVIDPADTRRWITMLTREVADSPRPPGRVRPNVDTW